MYHTNQDSVFNLNSLMIMQQSDNEPPMGRFDPTPWFDGKARQDLVAAE